MAFWRTLHADGRWWLVDPAGHRTISKGVNSVEHDRNGAPTAEAFARIYGDVPTWVAETKRLLEQHSFNTVGSWSADNIGMPRCPNLTMLASYRQDHEQILDHWAAVAGWKKPHDLELGLAFEADFADRMRTRAHDLVMPTDQFVLGYFLDNELGFRLDLVDLLLPAEPAFVKEWFKDYIPDADDRSKMKNKILDGSTSDSATKTRKAFLKYCSDRYFSVVAAAVRAADPGHLILGTRFNTQSPDVIEGEDALHLKEVFGPAGTHCDVISVNYYGVAEPDRSLTAKWAQWSHGMPWLASEFYAMADHGVLDLPAGVEMPNEHGAGEHVSNQTDRKDHFKRFANECLDDPNCVGYHWFCYMDGDPTLDEDAGNKGIVGRLFSAYSDPLLKGAKQVNDKTPTLPGVA